MPKYLGNIKAGVVELLDSQVFVYSDELGGVPVAYKNIQLVQNVGRIIDDQTCIHFDIKADFILFKPQIGSTLTGVINKVGKQHIGCLVHGKFNAWIPRRNPEGQTENLLGEEIQFVVTNIFTNNNILSLKGIVDEERFTALKKHRKKNKHTMFDDTGESIEDISIDSLSQFESGAVLSSTKIEDLAKEQKKEKKRKKHRQSIEEPTIKTETEDVVEEKVNNETVRKKRKKQKYSIEEPAAGSEVELGVRNLGDEHVRKKRKKLKESVEDPVKNLETETVEEGHIIDEPVRKKRKKHKQSLEAPYLDNDMKAVEGKSEKRKKYMQSLEEPVSETMRDIKDMDIVFDNDKVVKPVKDRRKFSDLLTSDLNNTNSNKESNEVQSDPEEIYMDSKRLSLESDEGYHTKKKKKKHKSETVT